MRETRQLVLDLPVEARSGPEDFLVSASNEAAYERLEGWPEWSDDILHLWGPSGCGKSHLAAIWAARTRAWIVSTERITLPAVPGLAGAPALAVEDLGRAPVDEPALFHLLNLARERGRSVLITSAAPIDALGLATPDLLSRLRLAPTVALDAPDDALMRAVLVKLLMDRQLVVDTSVVEFVATRIERSLTRAAAVVAALDREALSRGRRVTRPIAAALFAAEPALADEGG